MITAAIEALDDKEGSTKLAISSYIESNYTADLPSDAHAHTTLLSNALDNLTHSGHLLFFNNNYLLKTQHDDHDNDDNEHDPDPDPPKRGRGRPPKSKSSHPPAALYLGPPRGRGRPPKPRDPLAPPPQPKKPSPGSGRPRGRPRKNPDAVVAAPLASDGVKRGRGRPPKARP